MKVCGFPILAVHDCFDPCWPLRAHRERPRYRAAQNYDELAPPHVEHEPSSRLRDTGVASENPIQLTRGRRRIRTSSPHDCNRPPIRPLAVRLLQVATAAGSRDPRTATSAQYLATASASPISFALARGKR